MQETAQNLFINLTALGVFVFFLGRDFSAQRRDEAIVKREETLGRLQV